MNQNISSCKSKCIKKTIKKKKFTSFIFSYVNKKFKQRRAHFKVTENNNKHNVYFVYTKIENDGKKKRINKKVIKNLKLQLPMTMELLITTLKQIQTLPNKVIDKNLKLMEEKLGLKSISEIDYNCKNECVKKSKKKKSQNSVANSNSKDKFNLVLQELKYLRERQNRLNRKAAQELAPAPAPVPAPVPEPEARKSNKEGKKSNKEGKKSNKNGKKLNKNESKKSKKKSNKEENKEEKKMSRKEIELLFEQKKLEAKSENKRLELEAKMQLELAKLEAEKEKRMEKQQLLLIERESKEKREEGISERKRKQLNEERKRKEEREEERRLKKRDEENRKYRELQMRKNRKNNSNQQAFLRKVKEQQNKIDELTRQRNTDGLPESTAVQPQVQTPGQSTPSTVPGQQQVPSAPSAPTAGPGVYPVPSARLVQQPTPSVTPGQPDPSVPPAPSAVRLVQQPASSVPPAPSAAPSAAPSVPPPATSDSSGPATTSDPSQKRTLIKFSNGKNYYVGDEVKYKGQKYKIKAYPTRCKNLMNKCINLEKDGKKIRVRMDQIDEFKKSTNKKTNTKKKQNQNTRNVKLETLKEELETLLAADFPNEAEIKKKLNEIKENQSGLNIRQEIEFCESQVTLLEKAYENNNLDIYQEHIKYYNRRIEELKAQRETENTNSGNNKTRTKKVTNAFRKGASAVWRGIGKAANYTRNAKKKISLPNTFLIQYANKEPIIVKKEGDNYKEVLNKEFFSKLEEDGTFVKFSDEGEDRSKQTIYKIYDYKKAGLKLLKKKLDTGDNDNDESGGTSLLPDAELGDDDDDYILVKKKETEEGKTYIKQVWVVDVDDGHYVNKDNEIYEKKDGNYILRGNNRLIYGEVKSVVGSAANYTRKKGREAWNIGAKAAKYPTIYDAKDLQDPQDNKIIKFRRDIAHPIDIQFGIVNEDYKFINEERYKKKKSGEKYYMESISEPKKDYEIKPRAARRTKEKIMNKTISLFEKIKIWRTERQGYNRIQNN